MTMPQPNSAQQAEGSQEYGLLSPFPEMILEPMWLWLQQYHDQMVDTASPQSFDEMVAHYRDCVQDDSFRSYAIVERYAGKLTPVGAVWGEHAGDGIYVGHLVFSNAVPSTQRLTLAIQAVEQFFADGARKIQWQSFADNIAYHRFLLKMGATVEGRLREGGRKSGGELTDVLLMASFPDDFQTKGAA
jgi:RimJ/RimL family protein N-acetyltransferase